LVYLFLCHLLAGFSVHHQDPWNAFTSYECKVRDKTGRFCRSTYTWNLFRRCRFLSVSFHLALCDHGCRYPNHLQNLHDLGSVRNIATVNFPYLEFS
jgi:hypothetical protein